VNIIERLQEWLDALTRTPAVQRLLVRLGINPHHYLVLRDLFVTLGQRGQIKDQLGMESGALAMISGLYAVIAAGVALIAALSDASPDAYLFGFLLFTSIFLLTMLLSEAGNSLVNPVEGLVLAHQPITGATYTAAKLTHLLIIVVSIVVAMNGIPAVLGLMLSTTTGWYPLKHLGLAFAMGLVLALGVCGLFGWLLRFVPVRRLRMAALLVSGLPFVGFQLAEPVVRVLRRADVGRFIPDDPAVRWAGMAAGVALAATVIAFGLRALSADYLVSVSDLMHGEGSRHRPSRRRRRSPLAALIGRIGGGQPARAGITYVFTMMRRDWHFRRGLMGLVVTLVFGAFIVVVNGWPADPFGEEFSQMHLVLHYAGVLVLALPSGMNFGSDRQGAWLFQTVPDQAFTAMARGIGTGVWLTLSVLPWVVCAPLMMWLWGPAHGLAFAAYAVAVCTAYAAIGTRALRGIPFSEVPGTNHLPSNPALALTVPFIVAILVAIEHYIVFRSEVLVAIVGCALTVAGMLGMRARVRRLAIRMRDQAARMSLPPEPQPNATRLFSHDVNDYHSPYGNS